MPLLKGESTAAPHESLFWRFSPQHAARSGNYKLVQFGDAPPKVFDLSKDIGEKNDLAASKPEVLKDLQAKYDAWNAKNVKPLWNQKSKFDENIAGDNAQESPKMSKQGRPRAERRQEKRAAKSGAATQS
jgi:hypothetical protein